MSAQSDSSSITAVSQRGGGPFEMSGTQKFEAGMKISSIDQADNQLFVGYQNGVLDKFKIDSTTMTLKHIKGQSLNKSKRIFQKDQIDFLRDFYGYLLVLSGGVLLCVDKENLECVQTVIEKNCVIIAINDSTARRILAVTKKKDLIVLDFCESPFGFKAFDKRYTLQELPLDIQFYGQKILYTNSKKEYSYLDLLTGVEIKIFPDVQKNYISPAFKILADDEIFIVTSNNFGIFVSVTPQPSALFPPSLTYLHLNPLHQFDGQVKHKNPMQFDSTRAINLMTVIDSYLVLFYEGVIEVFSLTESKRIQSIELNPIQARFIAMSSHSKFIHFATPSEVQCIFLVSFENQIKKVMLKGRIDKARELTSSYYINEREKADRLEELNVDSCWSLIFFGQVEKALAMIKDSFRYDIREFFMKFNNEDDIAGVIQMIKKNLLSESFVQDRQGQKAVGSSGPPVRVEEESSLRLKIINFLFSLCQLNRIHYEKFVGSNTIPFDFYYSSIFTDFKVALMPPPPPPVKSTTEATSAAAFPAFPLGDRTRKATIIYHREKQGDAEDTAKKILEQIDFFTIKYLIMENNEVELRRVLDSSDNYCADSMTRFQELREYFEAHMPRNNYDEMLSLFFEYFARPKDALNLWRMKIDDGGFDRDLACTQIQRILVKFPERESIFELLPLLVVRNTTNADQLRSLLESLEPGKFPPPQIQELISSARRVGGGGALSTAAEEAKRREILGIYQEILVEKYRYNDQNVHNALASYYVSEINREKKTMQKDTPSSGKEKLKKLDMFLQSSHAHYDPQFVLSLVEDCEDETFIDQKMFLLGKLGRNEQSLRFYIVQENYAQAMKLCESNEAKLLPIFFAILLEKYALLLAERSLTSKYAARSIRASQKTITNRSGSEPSKKLFENHIDRILSSNRTSEDFNPRNILEQIPDNWVLIPPSEKREGDREERGGPSASSLFTFLTSSITESLYSLRQSKCTRQASEMHLLQNKLKLLEAKKAYFTQLGDRKCSICNKAIMQNTIFVVFPNGILAHQSCVPSDRMSICPETGFDFRTALI